MLQPPNLDLSQSPTTVLPGSQARDLPAMSSSDIINLITKIEPVRPLSLDDTDEDAPLADINVDADAAAAVFDLDLTPPASTSPPGDRPVSISPPEIPPQLFDSLQSAVGPGIAYVSRLGIADPLSGPNGLGLRAEIRKILRGL